ncbi:MAG: histidine kinase [Pseudomonadales bacterium]|nr:histidine kinase [Pseudomonadales bacterium]
MSTDSPQDLFLPLWHDTLGLVRLLLVALLLAVVLVLASTPTIWPFPWLELGETAMFVVLAVAIAAWALDQTRYWLHRLPASTGAAISYLVVLICVAMLSAVTLWLLPSMIFAGTWVDGPSGWFWMMRNELIAAIIGGILLRYLYLSDQLRRNQQAELSARLQALQSRIRPHFLFNSMNLIASLIPSDPDMAEHAIEDLSSLFRATLRESTVVPLSEEIDLCQGYINIEALRLGDRLHVEWVFNHVPEQISIPLLTLQPLVENAIYHGVELRHEPSLIHITLDYTDGSLCVKLCNPRPPPESTPRSGHQMALDNIRERLRAHYGEQAKLTLSADRDTFITTLSYPIKLTQGH